MKLTNKRIYLDFNSTSPLADSVVDYISKGDFFWANPSSIHHSGKNARKEVNAVKEYLFKHFSLSKDKFHLYFHSGVTEALNTFLQSSDKDFYYRLSDHSAVHELAKTYNGKLFSEGSIEGAVLNLTWNNNETGEVLPLEEMKRIKEATKAIIHVDAAQAVGKVDGYSKLDDCLDIYSFSGHKFGALKGIGFSFVKKEIEFSPLILGGGQQDGFRGGTENVLGISSLKLALEEVSKTETAKLKVLKNKIRSLIKSYSSLSVLNFEYEDFVTVSFYHQLISSDLNLVKFDMNGVDISSGSACSSGSSLPSNVYKSLGLDEFALNNLRISIGPKSLNNEDEILEKLKSIFDKL